MITARGVSKRYRIGIREPYRTVRGALTDAVTAPIRRMRNAFSTAAPSDDDAPDTIWALKDIEFDVAAGEVFGVIGRNGAGKSTLMKVLSRITEPTTGRIDLHGRVGSLLEVGTGFHPELSGRDNIYLNGAILGMRRAEIRRQFDEIAAFAEVEQFIDTPVKRYSSGMYVRLAFSVAAHLDPEILLVDEVLAVGDARFQRKCLGKMQDVAHRGRTVLFVSHNMATLQSLCTSACLLEGGRLVARGEVNEIIGLYHRRTEAVMAAVPLADRIDRRGDGTLRFTAVDLLTHAGGQSVAQSGADLTIALSYETRSGQGVDADLRIAVTNSYGHKLFVFFSPSSHGEALQLPPRGQIRCLIPELPLLPGRYRVGVWGKVGGTVADEIQDAFTFDVVPGDYFGTGKVNPADGGDMLVRHTWEIDGESP